MNQSAEKAQANYAAFVGAEAELARLRSAIERLADEYHNQAAPPIEPTDYALLGVAQRLYDLISPPGERA